jgi:Putative zinc finger motif, C2HC5-type
MAQDVSTWALPRLRRLLPIDDESLKEVIAYSSSLSKVAGAEHLKNMLGDSPQALEFISSFNSRRIDVSQDQGPSLSRIQRDGAASNDDRVPSVRKKASKKVAPPLHSTGQIRRPEGYGDITGGYTKTPASEDYIAPKSKNRPPVTALSDTLSLSTTSEAPQQPKVAHSPSLVSSQDPTPPRQKLPPSASGSLISDLPNVRTKQFKKPAHAHSGTSSPQKSTVATTSSIADLTSAIAALELSTNPSLSGERRKCPCNASIHPLFTTAPNCLSCGKIICALEGLQPCSFCDSPILTKDQVNSMIRALKEERGQERMATHNAATSHSGRGTPIFGGVGGTTPESSGDESSGAAARARAHRDKLLAFQRENVQRTKIHDEAADYDMSLTPGATQWMSPVQRATALKKQQKYMREMEEQNRPEWEKKRTVMSMSIKNGKLVKTFETIKAATPKDKEEEIEHDEDTKGQPSGGLGAGGRGVFSDNPLLASGKLIRPIWQAPEGESGKSRNDGESKRGRKDVWRRVQDGYDDNEQWILDGGLHGLKQEDGSVWECG